MSGIIGGAGSKSGVINITELLQPTAEINYESFQGGDYNITSASIVYGNFGNTIQISSLDAGYTYLGESHLSSFSGTYSASYLFNTSYAGTGGSAATDRQGPITYITRGSNYFVEINGGYIQVKETASGGTYTHYTKVRKMFKNV